MDMNELLKAAPELQKIVATIVAGVPVGEIVKRIVLPSADALGERMKNRVERLFEKTGKMLQGTEAPVQSVPDYILLPLLQGASLVDDEDLHDMSAALLANAASPQNADKVRPGFIAILKQMAPDEAALANWMWNGFAEIKRNLLRLVGPPKSVEWDYVDLAAAYARMASSSDTNPAIAVSLDNLEAYRLIEKRLIRDNSRVYSLTRRGEDFLLACQPPKPKS